MKRLFNLILILFTSLNINFIIATGKTIFSTHAARQHNRNTNKNTDYCRKKCYDKFKSQDWFLLNKCLKKCIEKNQKNNN